MLTKTYPPWLGNKKTFEIKCDSLEGTYMGVTFLYETSTFSTDVLSQEVRRIRNKIVS